MLTTLFLITSRVLAASVVIFRTGRYVDQSCSFFFFFFSWGVSFPLSLLGSPTSFPLPVLYVTCSIKLVQRWSLQAHSDQFSRPHIWQRAPLLRFNTFEEREQPLDQGVADWQAHYKLDKKQDSTPIKIAIHIQFV